MSATRSMKSGGWWLVWAAALLAGISAIYFPGLGNGPIFDDYLIESGELAQKYGGLFELRQRMLSYGSFVWLEGLFGEGWWKQRLFNLLIHFGVAMSLLGLFRLLVARVRWPDEIAERPDFAASRDAAVFVGVAVFAFNPVAVYAVAYLVQRSILMATLFVVLALLFFARGIVGSRRFNFVAALSCYVAAVLSKEHAVMALALAIPMYAFLRPSDLRRTLVLGGVALCGLLVVGSVLRMRYGSIIGVTFDELSRIYVAQLEALAPGIESRAYPLSIANQMALFFHYGFLWLLPNVQWMSIDLRPPFPLSLGDWKAGAGAAAFAALCLTSVYLLVRRDGPWRFLGLCLLIPPVLFATEFVTVWIQDPFVLYRSYLWAITIPGVVVLVLVGTRPPIVYLAGLVLSVVLISLSFERVGSFANTLTVWSDAVAKLDPEAPPNAVGRWRPYLNRGSYYLENDMLQLAYSDFARADELGELQGSARFNMGVVMHLMKRPAEAVKDFDLAAKRGFKAAGLHYHRGESQAALGRFDAAIDDLGHAIALEEDAKMKRHFRLRRADAAMKARRYEIAGEEFSAVLRDDPADYEVRLGLAMSFLGQNDLAAAERMLNELLGEKGHHAAYYGRALLNSLHRRNAEAVADINRAIELNPKHPGYPTLRARWLGDTAGSAGGATRQAGQ